MMKAPDKINPMISSYTTSRTLSMEEGYSPKSPTSEKTPTCTDSTKVGSLSLREGEIPTAVRPRVLHCLSIPKINRTAFVLSCFVFCLLLAAAFALSYTYYDAARQTNKDNALDMAEETGRWFSNALQSALTPVFSLAQFVHQVEPLKRLPGRIGNLNHNGSLPLVGEGPFRNVTGVCDQPDLVERYDKIAASIKEHANLPKILVMLALVPDTVVCLVHPLVNTQDFPPGVVLNNTGLIGLDMFAHKGLRPSIETALEGTEVVLVGPQTVTSCTPQDVDCHPLVEKAFFARLPIYVPHHTIDIKGQAVPRWGLAVVKLNWSELVAQSQMYEKFQAKGYQFQLTRVDDPIWDDDRGDYKPAPLAILAESDDFERETNSSASSLDSVSTKLLTKVNREWTMTVLYNPTVNTEWIKWVVPLSIVVSFLMALLVYLILQQKHQAQDLKAESKAYESKIETERNMTAYFAHELRNPLGAIDSALMAMPDGLPQAAVELVHGMQLCSKFMTSIMSNLMDVRRMEEGKMEMHNSPLDLRDALETVHKMFEPSVKPGVDFSVLLEEDNGGKHSNLMVLGDVHRFEQILTNIVSNAIKYTHNGSIRLSIGWVAAQGKDKSKWVQFLCADTGPGIPKADQGNLFKRFVKRGGAPGSGLGLAISKHIVDLMGGTIEVESNPQVQPGTTFRVCLPLQPYHCKPEEGPLISKAPQEPNTKSTPTATITATTNAPGNAQPNSSPSASASLVSVKPKPIEQELHFLICDDIKMNRMMLKRRFQKGVAPNSTITEASTGEEALSLCERETFDVIIMDQYMEEAGGAMLGTDTVIALKRTGVSSLVIGCSGNDMEQAFAEAGAAYVWKKPVPSNAVIIDQLRKALPELANKKDD